MCLSLCGCPHFFRKMRRVNVYYDAIKFLQSLDINTSKCPRWLVYERLNTMKAQVTDIVAMIVEGTCNNELLPQNILNSLKLIEIMKFKLRGYKDCNYLTSKGYSEISRRLESVRRQLKGWGISIGLQEEDFIRSFNIYDSHDNVTF